MGLGTSLVSHMQFALTVMGLDEEERREIVGEMGGANTVSLLCNYTQREQARKAGRRMNAPTR